MLITSVETEVECSITQEHFGKLIARIRLQGLLVAKNASAQAIADDELGPGPPATDIVSSTVFNSLFNKLSVASDSDDSLLVCELKNRIVRFYPASSRVSFLDFFSLDWITVLLVKGHFS